MAAPRRRYDRGDYHDRHKVKIVTLKNPSLSRTTELFIDGMRAITKPLARKK
jgi:hypothetical protein